MTRYTAAEAVWYALCELHREQPRKTAFDKRIIAERAEALGFWNLQRQTLYQHLSQWVNAQSPSESARGAYVVAQGRGGPYRLLRPTDDVAANRRGLPVHPDPQGHPEREAAVAWYRGEYAPATRRPMRPARRVSIDDETATAVHAHATAHGMDDSASLALLVQRGLARVRAADPMLALAGIAAGDATTGRDHDEVLYG